MYFSNANVHVCIFLVKSGKNYHMHKVS